MRSGHLQADSQQQAENWTDDRQVLVYQADALYAAYRQAVELDPLALAVDAPDGRLSFAELDAWSDQIAARLRAPAGSVVAVFLSPSTAYYAAVVACMKLGALVQPLDPATPVETNPEHLPELHFCLTLRQLSERVRTLAPTLVCIEAEPGNEAALPPVSLQPTAARGLHRLLTSGSSGTPTLATVGRDAILLHRTEMRVSYEYCPGSLNAGLNRHTVAAGLHCFWRLLLSGCGLLCFDLRQESFEQVYQRLQTGAVISIQGVPTVLDALASACLDKAPLPSVRRLIFGGETLLPAQLRRIAALIPPESIVAYNYSSSETMQITVFTAPLAEALQLDTIPCGRPLPSRQVEVLGPDLQPVPDGEPGEIVVTAAVMAIEISGGKAAERLRVHPQDPDLKIYHTGDLGRWNAQGQLEHLGRLDRRLKVRGVRVDPYQIEHLLAQVAGVNQVIVAGVPGTQQRTELVALVVRDPEQAPLPVLEAALRARLPEAFVPTRWIDIASVPQLPSGKMDMRALEQLARAGRAADSEQSLPEPSLEAPPETALAALLRQEWARVLGREVSPAAGSFVSEGGDSLAATHLVTCLTRLGVPELTPLWVVRHPTLAAQEQALVPWADILQAAALAGAEALTARPGPASAPAQKPRSATAQTLDRQTVLNRLGWV